MRLTLKAAAIARSLLLLFLLSAAGAPVAIAHDAPQSADPAGAAKEVAELLPLVTPDAYNQMVLRADRPVFVLVVFSHCWRCHTAARLLAKEAREHPEILFVAVDGTQFGYAAATAPAMYGVLPGYGTTFQVDAVPSGAKMLQFLTERISFALKQWQSQQDLQHAQQQLSADTSSYADQMASNRQQRTSLETQFDDRISQLEAQHAEDSKKLLGLYSTLMKQLQELESTTTLPDQAHVHAAQTSGVQQQLQGIQARQKQLEAKFKSDKEALQAAKAAQLSSLDSAYNDLAAKRDQDLSDRQHAVEACKQQLDRLIHDDRQAALAEK